uniref:Uncharacterized protein n=1 Tax=Heterorhabditis bacteriophora TaxID=37862 RepID=A0A1I7WYI7_HETBA
MLQKVKSRRTNKRSCIISKEALHSQKEEQSHLRGIFGKAKSIVLVCCANCAHFFIRDRTILRYLSRILYTVDSESSMTQVLRISLVLIVLFDAICKNVLLHGHEICQGLHYSSLCHVLPEDHCRQAPFDDEPMLQYKNPEAWYGDGWL